METLDLQSVIREKLKRIRSERNIEVIEIAKALGYCSEKGYYDLESGRTDIKIKHIEILMGFYKLPKEAFF
jgi:transcriptional regulator with XRE-family HTH domain